MVRSGASIALAALFHGCVAEAASGPIVMTESGEVRGFTDKKLFETVDVDVFRGIPYAAAPVGENRLRPPLPFTEAWAPAVLDATGKSPICMQNNVAGNLVLGQEDCLYIDVYRPNHASLEHLLPVMVWIYGGGFNFGDGYEVGWYDGTNLARRHNFVVVTMNYRLSTLGFFGLPELFEEHGTTGNYAMQDQRAAMQWVQRNVKAFGGDPTRVTLAGESAGGASVMYHTVAPASRGLFHAAIAESAPLAGHDGSSWYSQNKSLAFEFYKEFSAIVGCDEAGPARLTCLRGLPAHKLLISWTQMVKDFFARFLHLPLPDDIPDIASPLFPLNPCAPVIDGTDVGLPDVPLHMIQRGDFAKVPLITGANKDGGVYFGVVMPLTWGTFRPGDWVATDYFKWILKDEADRERAAVLYSDFPNDRLVMDRAFRDMFFQCSNREVATAWTQSGAPAYLYTFSFDFKGATEQTLGDCHASELPFVWRNNVDLFASLSIFGRKKDYEAMSDIMSCTWASFIDCQSPRCPTNPPNCDAAMSRLPTWPVFNPEGRSYLSLKGQPAMQAIQATAPYNKDRAHPGDEFPGDDKCDFWASANLDWQQIRQRLNDNILMTLKATSAAVLV